MNGRDYQKIWAPKPSWKPMLVQCFCLFGCLFFVCLMHKNLLCTLVCFHTKDISKITFKMTHSESVN